MITRGPKGLQLEVRAQWAPGLLHSRWSLLLLFVCMYIACKASVAWRALVIRCDTVAEWKWKRGQWCCLTKSGGSYHIELLSELIKAGKRKTWTRTSPAFNPHCEAGVSRPRTWNGYFWYPNTTNQSIIQHWFIVKKNRPYPLWGPILHPDHRWDETPKTWALQQLLWQLGVP